MFRLRNMILLWLGRKAWGAGRSAWRRRQSGRGGRERDL
jgi:hypothetical protein